jgi:hypothetical protein
MKWRMNMLRRVIGFIAFAVTSLSFLGFILMLNQQIAYTVIVILIIIPTLFGLFRHWFECTDCKDLSKRFVFDKAKFYIFIAAFASVIITWFMNHTMGLGAFIANGTVGLIAATLFPPALAGTTYAASFVGMSSTGVLPTIGSAVLGGIVVGIVLVFTAEIYAGIGGKGGTTAALSAQITRILLSILK